MTYRANLTWQRALDKRWKAPIYLLVLDKVRSQDSSDTIPAVRYSTAQISQAQGETDVILKNIKGASAQVTPLEGRTSIGSVSFSLLEDDANRQITKLCFRYPMLNRKATLYMGFADIAELDYVPVFTGRIYSYGIQKDNLTWRFELYDLHSKVKADICAGKTNMPANIGPQTTIISVRSTAGFTFGNNYVGSTSEGKYYIKIDNEVISYTGITATSFTGCQRGAFNTVASVHQRTAAVTQFVVLTGSAIDIALQLLVSTGTAIGTAPGINGTYDRLPVNMGLSMDNSEIDIARFEEARDRWGASQTLQIILSEKSECKSFIEREIYRIVNAYPLVTGSGKLGCKVYTPPFPSVDQPVLDDTVLLGAPAWQGDASVEYFINEVLIAYDYDWRSKRYLRQILMEDADSQVKYGKVASYTIESKGLRSTITSDANVQRIGLRILKRFSNPPPVIKAKAFLPLIIAEIGDVALFSSAKVPDLQRGLAGVSNALMEVTETIPDYEKGQVSLALANTQFSYGRKYAAISPSSAAPTSFPVYTSATAAQRKYAFISRRINNTFGVMSTGDDGYYISP